MEELENGRNAPANSTENVDSSRALRTISLPIWGMSCLSCARKIEEALRRCPGVAGADVDFVPRQATVRFDPRKGGLGEFKAAVEAAGYQVLESPSLLSTPHPYLAGVAISLSVVGFYLGLITLTSDWDNAKAEFREYGYWILALAVGLGVQAMLFSFLRAWHKGGSVKGAKCTLAASGGISTTAMAVCCSHYLFALLPALGLPFLSTAAASLADHQTYFFLAGVVSNLFGIGLMIRMMDKSGMIQLRGLVSHVSFGFFPVKR